MGNRTNLCGIVFFLLSSCAAETPIRSEEGEAPAQQNSNPFLGPAVDVRFQNTGPQFDYSTLNLRPQYLKVAEEAKHEIRQAACKTGDKKACDTLPIIDYEPRALAPLLNLPQGYLRNLFVKDKLYVGSYLMVIQKVAGGYLFQGNPELYRASSLAFLKSQLRISPDRMFCAWFFYIGDLEYTALDGFGRKIPSFRIYDGDTPTKNSCEEQNGRLIERRRK